MFKLLPIEKPQLIDPNYKVTIDDIKDEFQAVSIKINEYIAMLVGCASVIIVPFIIYLSAFKKIAYVGNIIFMIFMPIITIFISYWLVIGIRELIYLLRIKSQLIKLAGNVPLIPKYKIKYVVLRLSLMLMFITGLSVYFCIK